MHNSDSSASDELLILIERLSVKGEDLKSAVTRGRLGAITDPLCYQGFHLRPLPWLLMFARAWLQSWGPGGLSWVAGSVTGQWQTLHSVLIIAIYHQQMAPRKTRPVFRDSVEDEQHVFLVPLFGLSVWTVLMALGLVDACLKERHICRLHENQSCSLYLPLRKDKVKYCLICQFVPMN